MKSFFSFFIKYYFAFLFIILEIINLVLIISYNHQQRTVFINSSNYIVGSIEEKTNNISEYLNLKNENKKLHEENANLRNQVYNNFRIDTLNTLFYEDSIVKQQFNYQACKVIQSSIFKTKNYLTIDIGKKQGIKKCDAVLSSKGVVGIVKKTSDNYAVVLPIINSDFNLSCRIEPNGYFGSLIWDGKNHKTAKLREIPIHVPIQTGDSLFTTGYSLLFPSNIYIGKIKSINVISGDSFYDIDIDLSVNFQTVQSVYVVSNLFKKELDSLLTE